MPDNFPALPGLYRLIFLHLEPISSIIPILFVWVFPGVSWFHQEQIPLSVLAPTPVDDRTRILAAQLANCFFLLGLLSSFVFRAVRDTLPNNPAGQERLIGASLLALGITDVTHALVTLIGLPEQLRYAPQDWNGIVHGNITVTLLLFFVRMAWFLGLGRTRFYFGQKRGERVKSN